MTAAAAILEFFNSFGIDAYPTTAVPDKAALPYLTYENMLGSRGAEMFPQVVLWHYTDSEKEPNGMTKAISDAIGECKSLKVDGGAVYIYAPEGWTAEPQGDTSVKKRTTNMKFVFNIGG